MLRKFYFIFNPLYGVSSATNLRLGKLPTMSPSFYTTSTPSSLSESSWVGWSKIKLPVDMFKQIKDISKKHPVICKIQFAPSIKMFVINIPTFQSSMSTPCEKRKNKRTNFPEIGIHNDTCWNVVIIRMIQLHFSGVNFPKTGQWTDYSTLTCLYFFYCLAWWQRYVVFPATQGW